MTHDRAVIAALDSAREVEARRSPARTYPGPDRRGAGPQLEAAGLACRDAGKAIALFEECGVAAPAELSVALAGA